LNPDRRDVPNFNGEPSTWRNVYQIQRIEERQRNPLAGLESPSGLRKHDQAAERDQ
jgi:hypothetical protein